jgi:polyhydroxybutyrate depolymerase
MKILKYIVYIIVFIFALIAGAYFYFLHVPNITQPELTGDYESQALKVGGVDRTFNFYRPKNLTIDASLVFVLHGSKRSGSGMRKTTGFEFDQLADSNNYIAVYPDGFENHWNDCRGSATYTANTKNIDDVAFITQMVTYFVGKHGVEPKKVFVTGLSNGGHMAFRLALEAPDLVAAIAPMAANLPVTDNLDCKQSNKPVSVALFNGTLDPINPYQGGLVELFGDKSRGHVLSTDDTIQYWLSLANIQTEPVTVKHPELDGNADTQVEESVWNNSAGINVKLFTLHGSGHVVPSKVVGSARILGPTAGDISGPEQAIKFFLHN